MSVKQLSRNIEFLISIIGVNEMGVIFDIICIFIFSVNFGLIIGYYSVGKEIPTELKQNIFKLRMGFKIISIVFLLPTFILTHPNIKIDFHKIFYKSK